MEYPKGTIQEISLNSRELAEEINLFVYLPASFSTLYKYSFLIAQDGRDYFQLGRIGRTADELLYKQEIENLIIVGIPYNSVEDRRNKYHPRGERNKEYIHFLSHEFLPFLDNEFPSYQIGMGRALIGDSLAATVSLMTALQYPHSFGKVLLQSPYVNDDVLHAVDHFGSPSLLSIYHVVGNQETSVKTSGGVDQDFLSPNLQLSGIFKRKNFSYIFDEFEGNHTWTYWQPDIKRALKRMFAK
ncbi:alpha/beta hydrolase [Bacillus sp. T33-2]|uniref:alpha/beta hydrolase n=1 Tax=Bacillus sp. T33-2 TaxID=2054168 RepID=UPI000C78A313|nr:alpha/beta hydrolase-fold protein [Bacillus sp. T33-2]PLR97579.1 hypothetical protein CVD19_08860 [Bacillus sp. T33-2]